MAEYFEVVDDDCIGCGLCSKRAPENFELPTDAWTARVFKQPDSPEEKQACLDATNYCPVGGIKSGPHESSSAALVPGDIPPTRSNRSEIPPLGPHTQRLES
ncbi:MAG: ferredoxin [Pseudomonadales bacterium]|nr:ferredoxin [Pseudomonadales bacterium]